MKVLLPIFALACTTVAAAPAMAQDAATEALQRKVQQQAQLITTLQAQLAEHQNENAAAPVAEAPSYTLQQSAPPPPPRRAVGVYQQPAEPKLTCADYSLHYFSRHPAMAAVCGVSAPPQPQAPAIPQEDHDAAE